MNWKFTDDTNTVAIRTWPDGSVESCLVSALPEGTVIEPAPFIDHRPARIGELKALLAATDYKVLPDYDRTTPQDMQQRQLWRDEIRMLENELVQDQGSGAL